MAKEKIDRVIEQIVNTKMHAELIKKMQLPLYVFEPRLDEPLNYDEQYSFVNDPFEGIKIAVSGNACISPESEVFDPFINEYRRVDSVKDDWHVFAWDEVNNKFVVARANKPFVKGVDDLFKVTFSTGRTLICTLKHRLLTLQGWLPVSELCLRESIGDIAFLGFDSPEKVYITKVEWLRKGIFYDFEVPKYHNYELAGVINHNSGKTECAAFAVVNFLFKNPPPRDLCPFLIASQSFDMTGQIFQEKIQKYIQQDQISHIRWRNAARQFPAEVILKPHNNGNRWVLDFRSFEQGRQQFQAVSIAGFWCDEQCDMEILTEIFMRCRDYDYTNNKFYTLTPLEPDYQLEELYKNRFEDNVKNSFRFYRMNTMANTAISSKWKQNFFDVVPEDMHATRQIGAFARFEGLIYKEFRDETHVIPQKKLTSDAIHYRSIDFGYRNAACLWGAYHQGRWLIYDELLLHDVLTEDLAQLIKDKSMKYGWKNGEYQFRQTFADWEDPASMVRLKQFEIYPTPARKEVGAGIDCVRQKFIGAGKVPQLLIMDNCKELIHELKEYSWQKPAEHARNRMDEQDKPIKFHDHLCDALRYLIFSKEMTIEKPWSKVDKKPFGKAMYGR